MNAFEGGAPRLARTVQSVVQDDVPRVRTCACVAWRCGVAATLSPRPASFDQVQLDFEYAAFAPAHPLLSPLFTRRHRRSLPQAEYAPNLERGELVCAGRVMQCLPGNSWLHDEGLAELPGPAATIPAWRNARS